jgi:hypothetical protein
MQFYLLVYCHMSTTRQFLYIFLKIFTWNKIQKMFSSSKIENGGWISNMAAKTFFYWSKFQKWYFFKRKLFCCIFWLKIQLMWNNFFSKNSKWRINQNGDFFLTNFWRCSNFVCRSFMFNFFLNSDRS